HRETAPAAVAPGGVHQRLEHGLGRDVADALEVLQQHALLGVDLLRFVQVLQRAATAGAEVDAARRHPVGRRLQHLERARLVEAALAACRTGPRSPGRAPATTAVWPARACPSGLRATPRPSWLRSLTSSSRGVGSRRARSGPLLPPVAARIRVPPARTRALDPLRREHA